MSTNPGPAADEIVGLLHKRYPALLNRTGTRAAALELAEAVFDGIAEHRLPTAVELSRHRERSRQAAEFGLPVDATTDASLLMLRSAWEHLPDGDIDLALGWAEAYAGAVSHGFADHGAGRQVYAEDVAGRLAELLSTGRRTLARALNLDPDGDFQALYIACPRPRDGAAATMNRWLRAGGETVALTLSGGAKLVVTQNVAAERILARLGVAATTVAGIGLIRTGLAGAVESVGDADRAFRLAALERRTVWFERDWLAATLLPMLDRLRPLLEQDNGGEHRHLESAIRAYARNTFSITQGARDLQIHPNSLKYRLDRWQVLTGWDPRTLDGLQRSLLSGLLRRS